MRFSGPKALLISAQANRPVGCNLVTESPNPRNALVEQIGRPAESQRAFFI